MKNEEKKGNQAPLPALDYVAITDGEGNVVAILDLVKKVIHYAGRDLPFVLVAGEGEKEYPSFYANAMIKALRNSRRRGGG